MNFASVLQGFVAILWIIVIGLLILTALYKIALEVRGQLKKATTT